MFPKVNYIGNKSKVVDWIISLIPNEVKTVVDAFSGGSSVSYALKVAKYNTISNDVLYSSFVINKSLVQNQSTHLNPKLLLDADTFTADKNQLIQLDFLKNNLFFSNEVEELEKLILFADTKLTGFEYYIFLSLIRRAMIRKLPYSRMNIDWNNIIKLRDEDYSYMKYGRKRAYHNKSFMYHMQSSLAEYNSAVFNSNKKHVVEQLDVLDLLKKYPSGDLIYLDPPYPGTMNNYNGFYGTFDKIFNRDIDYVDLTKKSTFLDNMESILRNAKKGYKYAMISLNNSIKPSFEEFISATKKFGDITIHDKEHVYQVSGSRNKHQNKEIIVLIKFYKDK